MQSRGPIKQQDSKATGWDHDTNNPLEHFVAPHFAQERIIQILFRICNRYIIIVEMQQYISHCI